MPSKVQQCRARLRKAHSLLSTKPQKALRIMEDLLEWNPPDSLLGESLGMLGLARQFTGDLEGAHSAFASARSVETSRLRQGFVYCQWAFLDLDRHRAEEALKKASKGLALIESADPPDRIRAQGLVARGAAFRHNGFHDQATADNRQALAFIHPRRDADLHIAAVTNLGIALLFGSHDPDQIREALRTIDKAADLLRRYRIPQKSIQHASLLWTKGLAYRIVAADQLAEQLLTQARKTLFDLEYWPDWLRVSLDLIELYIHYDRWGMVAATLEEMLDHAGDTETLAILQLFHEAVRRDAVTGDIVRDVYARIHGHNRKPPLITGEYDPFDSPIGF